MKKYITAAALLVAGTALSNAAFVWTGTTETPTTTEWATESNWTLTDGTVWPTAGNGPLSTGSDAWGTLIVNNGSSLTYTTALEGWVPKLEISNGSSLTLTFGKFQGDGSAAYISVAEDAGTMTLNINGAYKDGSVSTFTVLKENGLTMNLTNPSGVDANLPATFVLGENGSITYTATGATTLSGATTINATLSGSEGLNTRDLLTTTNVTFSNLICDFGEGWTLSDEEITAENYASHVGQYFVSTEGGKVSVSYVIPEPSAFGLLAGAGALALVASRRRRRAK